MARPTKRTPLVEKRLINALRGGNTRRAACAGAGISEDTLAAWLKRFSDFAESVQKAEADAEMRHVANIVTAAGEGNWTASAWWLERRRPNDWGKVDRIEITIRERAEKLAAELGVDATALIAEAERIAARA